MNKIDLSNLKIAELSSAQLVEMQNAEKRLNNDRTGHDVYLLAFTRS